MGKAPPELSRPINPTPQRSYPSKQHTNMLTLSFNSHKLFILLLTFCAILFTLLQFLSIFNPPSLSLFNHFQKVTNCTIQSNLINSSTTHKLKESVTFLPLKDLRYSDKALQDHTWFMSSMYDTHEEGEVQYQEFPSKPSNGRLLCLKGKDTHDGSWNSYALAWPEALPFNTTLLKGLTFVSYNHYNYDNIWHGLSAVFPFVAWHKRNGCALPNRWVLYHWGELRFKMGLWLNALMEATLNGPPYIEGFEWANGSDPVCFERAVVMRHNEGGMSKDRRMEIYDLIRCKARSYCNVSLEDRFLPVSGGRSMAAIGMTLLMRNGPRSFRNQSEVIKIFEKECAKVESCKLRVAYSNNLTVCEQVKLMTLTDILISPHGAQLTNMFLMDRNSSVMEFFPKGWLKLAGVGQYVYHWIASWSGMRHQGAWRDPDGPYCPYPEDDRRCMSIYKSGTVGYNETYFGEWAKKVLDEVKTRKLEEATKDSASSLTSCACT